MYRCVRTKSNRKMSFVSDCEERDDRRVNHPPSLPPSLPPDKWVPLITLSPAGPPTTNNHHTNHDLHTILLSSSSHLRVVIPVSKNQPNWYITRALSQQFPGDPPPQLADGDSQCLPPRGLWRQEMRRLECERVEINLRPSEVSPQH